MSNVVPRPGNYYTPPRPRQSDPTQEDYESEEDYNAWVGTGEPGPQNQPTIETPEEREIRLAGGKTSGGGYGKKRKGEESRGQMNLTSARTSSILTSKPIG